MKINATIKCLILGMLLPLYLASGLNAQVIEAPESPGDLQLLPLVLNMDNQDVNWEGFTFFPFEGAALERIANPDKSGLNDTDFVLQYIKAAGQPWAGFFYHLEEVVTVTDQTVFKMKVWSNVADITALLKLELQAFPDVNTGDMFADVTASGEWLELEWDLSGIDRDAPWDRVVIIMDLQGPSGTGGDRFTWYLDNFSFLDGTTSIDQISTEVPQDLQLKQNYPNPFNPTTTIEFGLADASFTTLEVYNMLGQRMAVLANEQLAAGWHRVNLDASALSSGTYIYRLQAGDRVETRKLMLIK
ncbi:MAG: T9SS type A sorting domain-containing protein [Cyclonatronaceae bacterium]